MSPSNISIVVPCYNEEEVLPEASSRLLDLLAGLVAAGKISGDSRIYFVDDGSRDRTWSLIRQLSERHAQIEGIKLSRNRGHQNALMAGLFSATGDAVVSIDADLQDDLDAIVKMVDDFRAGSEIVLGVRLRRDTDTAFKRNTAMLFYRLMRKLGAESVDNHADFRLLSRRALDALAEYREVNLFLRGIVPLLGYKTTITYYNRSERFAGESKYPLRKMLGFALNGITSFSITPLRLITATGFALFLLTMAVSLWVLWVKVFTNNAAPGWASTVLPLYFVSGVQILCLGIIGEYLGKLYIEVKQRPRYFIETNTERQDRVPAGVASLRETDTAPRQAATHGER